MTPNTPNLAQNLVRIHKVITRALDVSLIHGKEYLESESIQSQELPGYSRYTHCLASVLGSHHQGEDLIAFPAFRKVLPFAPYEQLAIDHHGVEMLLASLPQAITGLSGDTPKIGLSVIVDTLTKITEIWAPHIQLEEQYFSKEALNAVFILEEQQQISEASSKHSQEHSGPPSWIIPFILFNLEHEDSEAMAAFYPPTMMDELIPKVWKDQWEPMKPFLLD